MELRGYDHTNNDHVDDDVVQAIEPSWGKFSALPLYLDVMRTIFLRRCHFPFIRK